MAKKATKTTAKKTAKTASPKVAAKAAKKTALPAPKVAAKAAKKASGIEPKRTAVKERMSKTALFDAITEETGLDKKQVKAVMDALGGVPLQTST